MNIVVIGLSHHTSPVELRERFAFSESKIPGALKSLRASGVADEAVILSTCNRVEIYAATKLENSKAFAELKKFLLRHGGAGERESVLDYASPLPLADAVPEPKAPEDRRSPKPDGNSDVCGVALSGEKIYTFTSPHSLQHLFKVACGLDSMILGETEILGQLKDAYKIAHAHKHTGARLNKIFQRAFHVAKHIRTHTNIQRGSVSVASVAVELAEKIFSSLAEREVLVIGAGETSEKVARALFSRGAKSIIVASRTFERAEILAKEFSGRAVQFDHWENEFGKIDIAISSTSAPHYILDRAKLEPLIRA